MCSFKQKQVIITLKISTRLFWNLCYLNHSWNCSTFSSFYQLLSPPPFPPPPPLTSFFPTQLSVSFTLPLPLSSLLSCYSSLSLSISFSFYLSLSIQSFFFSLSPSISIFFSFYSYLNSYLILPLFSFPFSLSGSRELVWATSWGVSTRLIGAMVMSHSDDKGTVLLISSRTPSFFPYIGRNLYRGNRDNNPLSFLIFNVVIPF